MDWIALAVVALFLFGASRILYIKASAQEAIPEDKFLRSLYFAGLATMSPLALAEWHRFTIGNIYSGIVLGLLSVLGSLALYRAVSVSSPSIVNVIIGLNFIIPLVVGLLVLKEKLTYLQTIGLALALITIILSTLFDIIQEKERKSLTLKGLAYTLITFFTWGLLGVAVKFLYNLDILQSVSQCLCIMYLSGLVTITVLHRTRENSIIESISKLGIAAGLLSSVGSYLVTLCYAIGEISITALITRFSYLLPAAYSLATSCEKLTYHKIVILALSIISVVLLSL